jgi:dCMP deaminase
VNCGSNRPALDLYYMRMARLVATRSTCLRRAVGCVLVDGQGRVLSTGYNGVARGEHHCNEPFNVGLDVNSYIKDGQQVRTFYKDTEDGSTSVVRYRYPHACAGAGSPSGTNLGECAAIHAEQNALVQCRNADDIMTCYVTVSPCDSCLKLFMNTGCREIIVGGWYAGLEQTTRGRWVRNGRSIKLINTV